MTFDSRRFRSRAIWMFLSCLSVLLTSEEIPARAAKFAVNGEAFTRWSSERTDDQWIQLDLKTPQHIGKVRLNWEVAFAKEYKLLASDDGQNWREVLNVTNGQGGEEECYFSPITARYSRLQGVNLGSGYGYSLWE